MFAFLGLIPILQNITDKSLMVRHSLVMKHSARELSDSWKCWLSEHSRKLVLYARSRCENMEDAEDLLQEAVIRLWRYQAERGYVPPDLPLAFATMRHILLDHGRKIGRRQKNNQKVIQFTALDDVWNDRALEDDEDAANLRSAVTKLNDKLREVVNLKIWGELTFAEIGEALEISPNTAASRYRYGLAALSEAMKTIKNQRNG